MQKIDEQRWVNQLKEFESKGFFTNQDGTKALETDPKKKYGKDVVLPKMPKTAYTHFMSINIGLIKSKIECKSEEAMKECGKQWKEMSPKDKNQYEQMREEEKKRFEAQMSELMTNGYFLMDDGSKSSEHRTVVVEK